MAVKPEDVTTTIAFIKAIEEHPCLWNCTLKNYSRADLTAFAWRKIATQVNDTEHSCRDRWKNIRTSFSRTLKPKPNGKIKKPYYLARYLSFVVPFLKASSTSCKNQDNQDTIEWKGEMADWDSHDQDEEELPEIEQELLHNEALSKKRLLSAQNESEESSNEYLDFKKRKDAKKICKLQSTDPDWMYFQSLLPDLQKLDDRRKRTLKTKFMVLLNEQLDEVDEAANQFSHWNPSSSPQQPTKPEY